MHRKLTETNASENVGRSRLLDLPVEVVRGPKASQPICNLLLS